MPFSDAVYDTYDAVVIGGGFYGCAIAIYLARRRGLRNILLVERESKLLSRASFNNQARIHNGYHYPRSFTTAYRSRINLPLFVHEWRGAVKTDFTKLYAIARRNSKVTARQFRGFCKEIGASIEPADQGLRQLFDLKNIEDVFLAEEYVFDAEQLAKIAELELRTNDVEVMMATSASELNEAFDGRVELKLHSRNGSFRNIRSRLVFNCTYSGLGHIGGGLNVVATALKHEITEMALVTPPAELSNLGVTVMDGPFFSLMPFPARNLYTLSHVRYTPHLHWRDSRNINPYEKFGGYVRDTRFEWMARDAARFMPAIIEAKYADSLFEVKTVLVKNEADDGRPILFEKHPAAGIYSVLGGKIDNIYDVLELFDAEKFN